MKMEATIHDDSTVTLSGVDGSFRKVEEVSPVTQRFDDDGWNTDVRVTSCPRCYTPLPPFTRWRFCPGCGVKFKWGDE